MARTVCTLLLILLFGTKESRAGVFITTDVAGCLVRNYKHVSMIQKYGEEARPLISKIHGPLPFHPNAKTRDLAFKFFLETPHSPHVLTMLDGHPYKIKKILIDALEASNPEKRAQAMSNLEEWSKFERDAIEAYNHRAKKPIQWIEVDGVLVEKSTKESVDRIQAKLAESGIQTRYTPLSSPFGQRGALVIESIDSEIATKPLTPTSKIFETAEFAEIIRKAQDSGGAIIIDPKLAKSHLIAGYFARYNLDVDGFNWVIAVSPNTKGSQLIHELEHKIDHIDNGNVFPDSVSQNPAITKPTSVLGRTFYEAGKEFENRFISELNATTRQLKFYAENHTFPPYDAFNTFLYRGMNQQKVAIGRIFMNPSNPKHIGLYLKGLGTFWIPMAAVYVGITEIRDLIIELAQLVIDDQPQNP